MRVLTIKHVSFVGAGGVRALSKFLICQKFRQNLKKSGQRSFDVFNNINEGVLCYWVCK